MNRKHFLSSMMTAAAVVPVGDFEMPEQHDPEHPAKLPVIPPYLRKGDTIGITSPAGYITLTDIQPAMLQMQSWGYKVRVGDTIGKRDFTFGGTDDERLADFQKMMDDPGISAIMCARGGYGIVRIID